MHNKTREDSLFYKHRYGVGIFLLFMAYSFFISGNMKLWQVNSLSYSFHAVDFSVGFCSKVLPGAICNFLFEPITEEKVSVFLNVLVISCFLAISFLLEKVFLKTEREYRPTVAIMCAFFLTGPAAFSTYVKIFCMLDFYWLLFAVLTIFFLSKKQLYIFVIPAFAVSVMVHNGTMICYIPFLVILILYKVAGIEDKKEKTLLYVVLFLAVTASVSVFLYFALYEIDNVKYTMEEFNNIMASKGVTEFEYYNNYFYLQQANSTFEEIYGEDFNWQAFNSEEKNNFVIFLQLLVKRILAHMQFDTLGGNIVHFILVAPVVVFVYRFLFLQIKIKSENKLKKFSYLCSMLLFPATLILSMFFSTDRLRWLSNAFIPLFAFMLFVIYKDNGTMIKEIKSFISKIPLKYLIAYFSLYMITTGTL